jgi:NAD(P)-dependent dehydrogenase (short-subunit alcohol dehydrogenase family)
VSKAAVVKFTENLALETSRHDIAVFSVHPGLLRVGMGEQAFVDAAPTDSNEAHVFEWVRSEIDEGRGADPESAVEMIVRLLSGGYDELSGRQLSVHDDLDAVLDEIDDVRDRELYLLGVQRLPVTATATATAALRRRSA